MGELIQPITINEINTRILPDTINLFLRGSTFRTTSDDQKYCIKSIFEFLLADLIKNGIKIKIILTTYKNDKDHLLTKFLEEAFDGEIINIQLDSKLFRCNFHGCF